MSLYNDSKWKIFRDSVIELDGYKCSYCGRGKNDTILQVHHKKYILGCKPWEYATEDCETVCKGCHASIHGIIQPQFGWEYLGDEDLGDLVGTCENNGCGAPIRYAYTIYHENWGTLEVGTVCCDHLTDSEVASNLTESKKKYTGRESRFINSNRWKLENNVHCIKQGHFEIDIIENEQFYNLRINKRKSKINHPSLKNAKTKVFEIIENGELLKFFKEKNIDITESNRQKDKKK